MFGNVHRISQCEEDIKTLFDKVNRIDKEQTENSTKLNQVLVQIGEIKNTLDSLKSRPIQLWDKLVYGIIGAIATFVVGYILK